MSDSCRWAATIALLLTVGGCNGAATSPNGSTNDPLPIPQGKPIDRSSRQSATGGEQSAPETYKVKLETSKGDIIIAVNRKWSPNGADHFYKLVKIGFYDDCRFFRVVKGFMAQVGMNGDPVVHKRWAEANIPDDPVVESNKRGYVSFANTGRPSSRSTQFFINYRDNSRLDGMLFSPFGKVVAGMDVADSLFSGYGERPSAGGGQQRISEGGNAYLNRVFPKLDYIKKATVIGEEPKTDAPKKKATGKKAAAGKKAS